MMYQTAPGVTVLPAYPVQDTVYNNYKAKTARILGALQIFLAFVISILQIAILTFWGYMYDSMGFIAPPLVAPAFGIFAGSFGVHSSKTKSQCSVITTILLSIIAAIFYLGLAIGGGLLACFFNFDYRNYDNGWLYVRYLGISILVLGLVAAVVAMTQSLFCCRGYCSQPSQETVYHNYKEKPATQFAHLQIYPAVAILTFDFLLLSFWDNIYETMVFISLAIVGPSFGIIAASFGLYSSKSRWSVITTLVLSIIAAFFYFGLVILAGLLVFLNINYLHSDNNSLINVSNLDISLFGLGLVAAVVSMMQSAYCCYGCCSEPSQEPVTTAAQGYSGGTNGASNGSRRETTPAAPSGVGSSREESLFYLTPEGLWCCTIAPPSDHNSRDSKDQSPLAEYPYAASDNAKRGDKRLKTKDLSL